MFAHEIKRTVRTAHNSTRSGRRTSLTYSSARERTSMLKLPGSFPAIFRATPLMIDCAWLIFVPRFKRAIIVYAKLPRRSSDNSRARNQIRDRRG